MQVVIPNNNLPERVYILQILFENFLGLPLDIKISDDISNWLIQFNNSKLIFNDDFFHKNKEELSYLKLQNIPKKVNFVSNKFIVEKDIPVLYGNDELKIEKTEIYCGIDIFASSFFMLTRWEEYVNKNRDQHERFPSTESVAFKNNFLDRPIVNEYLEMLWNMLISLGYNGKRQSRNFEIIATHDVDILKKYMRLRSGMREIIVNLFKGRVKQSFSTFKEKLEVLLKLKQDNFDTFDYLMTVSEKLGIKSHFFFMGKGCSEYDNFYSINDAFVQDLIKKIKQRNHEIGFHPSYNAYNDAEQFTKEKHEVEKALQTKLSFGREHYLRFEVPTTWQIWEDNKMLWDSTLSYADREGFRCGVCYDYNVFNILTRQKLGLKERPLIVMEVSFIEYQPHIEPQEMQKRILRLIDKVRKYDGSFVFLWHNSSFNTSRYRKYQDVYCNIFNI